MSVFEFLFSQCNFRCCFSLNEKAQRKTRVSFRLRGADAVTAIFYFFAPVEHPRSVESAGWFQFFRNSGRTGMAMAMASRRLCGSPCFLVYHNRVQFAFTRQMGPSAIHSLRRHAFHFSLQVTNY